MSALRLALLYAGGFIRAFAWIVGISALVLFCVLHAGAALAVLICAGLIVLAGAAGLP